MIEAHAFLAVFTVQLLAMSVLYPARFIRHVRMQTARLPTERFAQLYPGVDLQVARERLLTRYRRVNTGIAVLGVPLLGWLISYVLRPGWDEDPVIVLISVYFMLQMLPQVVVAWLGFRFGNAHKQALLDAKRKATLQRRGLFDFISPFPVVVAVTSYVVFIAFAIYVEPRPGWAMAGVLTLVYAAEALVVYRALYGKASPLQTHAQRVHMMGVTVKVCVYSCIVCVAFFAITLTLDSLDLKRWMPLAQSVCLLITTMFCLVSLASPARTPDMDELRAQ